MQAGIRVFVSYKIPSSNQRKIAAADIYDWQSRGERHELALAANTFRKRLDRPTGEEVQHLQIGLEFPGDEISNLDGDQRVEWVV